MTWTQIGWLCHGSDHDPYQDNPRKALSVWRNGDSIALRSDDVCAESPEAFSVSLSPAKAIELASLLLNAVRDIRNIEPHDTEPKSEQKEDE